MTTSIGLGSDNDMHAPARVSRRGQAPGFQRFRVGELLITALYDGFGPIPAEDLHGGTPADVGRFLTEAFLPADGDRCTAVTAFLVEGHGWHILIDAGGGHLLGPDTGHVAVYLAAAQTDPADIDHVLLTHLHPDHAGGLISPDGQAAFPRATVHVAQAEPTTTSTRSGLPPHTACSGRCTTRRRECWLPTATPGAS
jgi:glyoxylase-like metal-dependent hydrolase (beta-lactamase superfamily II)